MLALFADVNMASVKDFLQDMEEDFEGLTWTGFSLRIGSYTRGVTRGTWDASQGLAGHRQGGW
jgi:hypothetical protein